MRKHTYWFYQRRLVRIGKNHGDPIDYAPTDMVEVILDGNPVLLKRMYLTAVTLPVHIGDEVYIISYSERATNYFGHLLDVRPNFCIVVDEEGNQNTALRSQINPA